MEKEKRRPQKLKFSYWRGYGRSTTPGRVYANTDLGSVYFDEKTGKWVGVNTDLESLDMDFIQAEALKRSSVVSSYFRCAANTKGDIR